MKAKNLLITLSVFFIVLAYSGCKKDSPSGPIENNPTTVTTTISGVVLDEFDIPVVGAQIKVSGQTAVSSSTGAFTFSNISVPKDRFVVNVTKSNFLENSKSDVPKSGGVSDVRITLVKAQASKTIDVSSGGNIATDNGTAVELAANSVVQEDGSPVNGNVKMSIAYLDPTSENFSSQIPGGDLSAVTTNGSSTTLYSYGIIKVDMRSEGGNQLKIKAGSTSKITVDIPPSMESTAPATIPLWYYDSNLGLWKEEGTATKQGDKYVGNVSHFSDWNCDVPGGTATVKGLVLDCNNAPVSGITVKIGQASAVTSSDGKFERRVPINVNFEIQVMANKNFGISSTPISVSGLAEGSVKDVGTIKIECPAYVKGSLKCDATVKFGQVVVSWQDGYSAQFTDGNGAFNIPVDINKNAVVSISTLDGKYKTVTTVTPASRGGIKDLGVIQVCDVVVTGDNKFTLDGDGFTNKTFSFKSDTTEVFGFYDPDSSLTYVWMAKTTAPDTIVFFMTFKGNAVGAAQNVMLYLSYNTRLFIAIADYPGYDALCNITKYSGIGGLIEGTFSGKMFDFSGQPGAFTTLSAGKFSVIRIVAQQLQRMKNITPKEYWKRLHIK